MSKTIMLKVSSYPTITIIGGGAAGFFTAVNLARLNSSVSVTILEKSKEVLSKVRVSGGGRCNVTHHCFDTKIFAQPIDANVPGCLHCS